MKTLLTLMLCGLAIGCSSSKPAVTPSPTPETRAKQQSPLEKALTRELDTSSSDDEGQRLEVREAVNEYIKIKYPDWKIEALSLNPFGDDSKYRVAADIHTNNQWKFAQFEVWFMVKENGETYWKVTENPPAN